MPSTVFAMLRVQAYAARVMQRVRMTNDKHLIYYHFHPSLIGEGLRVLVSARWLPVGESCYYLFGWDRAQVTLEA